MVNNGQCVLFVLYPIYILYTIPQACFPIKLAEASPHHRSIFRKRAKTCHGELSLLIQPADPPSLPPVSHPPTLLSCLSIFLFLAWYQRSDGNSPEAASPQPPAPSHQPHAQQGAVLLIPHLHHVSRLSSHPCAVLFSRSTPSLLTYCLSTVSPDWVHLT